MHLNCRCEVVPVPCIHFRPSLDKPAICRWWMSPPETLETVWEPFCCCTKRLDKDCPTQGANPQPQEEDSFE